MIRSKDDYRDYLEADRLALGRSQRSYVRSVVNLIAPDYIWDFQRLLRRLEYYKNVRNRGCTNRLVYWFLKLRYRSLSVKLGFTVPENVFGPGLAIVHWGTIVINAKAKIGANCRIHADTNIGASGGTDEAPRIGDNVYVAPGAKVFGDISIASNSVIGANSVVNRSFEQENTLIAGVPARVIKSIDIRQIIKHL